MAEGNARARELLALDHDHDPELRRRYEEAVRRLQDGGQSMVRRAVYLIVSVLGTVGGLAVASLALTEPASVPPITRIGLAMSGLFGISWGVLCAWGLVRRPGNLPSDRTLVVRVALGCTLLAALYTGVVVAVSDASPPSLGMLGVSLTFLAVAAVMSVNHRVEQAEVRTRKQILQVELTLAQVLRGREGPGAP
jgi:hypothetical protein